MSRTPLSCLLAAALLCAAPLQARQNEGLARAILQQVDLPGDKLVSVLAQVSIAPNGVVGRHTHPGLEMMYVAEGSVEMNIEGQPPKTVKAGESSAIPAGTVHSGKAGAMGAKLVITYIVDKDKPLASPAR